MQDVLLLNVGNTHTRLVLWRQDSVAAAECVSTAGLLAGREAVALPSEHSALPCFAACVVPALREHLERAWPDRVRWLTPAMPLGLDVSEVDCSTIGADRLANAAAAVRLAELPVLVVDFGTAISSVVVDARRRLLGGFILTGRHLARTALTRGTAQLPDIELAPTLPVAVGRSTRDAIMAGVDLGLLGALERLIRDVADGLPGALTTVAVGGDRDFFCNHLPGLTPGPPDFTLRGLAAVAERCLAAECPQLSPPCPSNLHKRA